MHLIACDSYRAEGATPAEEVCALTSADQHKSLPPRTKRAWGAAFLALLLVSPLAAQRGALTLPRSLDQLVDQAATIIRGHVVSARVERHPTLTNLQTIVVTLRVQQTLKGQAGQTFTFRQYIWDVRDRFDAAGYRKGQDLLLLMNPPTRYGLSSPAGLGQGRFRILRDAQGHEYALNGHANADLFRQMAPRLEKRGLPLSPAMARMVTQHRSGPVQLDELQNFIRTLAGTN